MNSYDGTVASIDTIARKSIDTVANKSIDTVVENREYCSSITIAEHCSSRKKKLCFISYLLLTFSVLFMIGKRKKIQGRRVDIPAAIDTVHPRSIDNVHPPSIDTVHPPSIKTVHPMSIDTVHPDTVHHGTVHPNNVHPDTVHPVKNNTTCGKTEKIEVLILKVEGNEMLRDEEGNGMLRDEEGHIRNSAKQLINAQGAVIPDVIAVAEMNDFDLSRDWYDWVGQDPF